MFVHEFENPLFEFEAAGPQIEPLFALPPTYRRRLSLGPYISFSLCPYIFPLSFYLFLLTYFCCFVLRAFVYSVSRSAPCAALGGSVPVLSARHPSDATSSAPLTVTGVE